MNYTLNQLQVFLKVTQTMSVTKAAEELHLTQPAVSIQLKNFQMQFDIPLTEVIGRKIFITEFGKEIAEAAENILNQVSEINFKTLEYRGKMSGKLRVSIVSTAKYVMPYFLSDFLNKNSGVELAIDVTNKSQVLESLEQNKVDFSLVSIIPENMNVERLDLLKNKLYLIGNTNKLFEKEQYSTNIFEKLPLIFREEGSGTRLTMEAFIKKHNISVVKKMEMTSNEAVKQAVIAGMGYSIMPLIGIKNELLNGDLQIIPVKGLPIETVWSLIWLKSKRHSPVVKAYLDYLEEEKVNIVNDKFDWYEKY